MSKKISMRIQTPPNDEGVRTDIHPITTADEVIVYPESDNPVTLTEKLKELSSIVVQEEQPTFPCLWAKPVE